MQSDLAPTRAPWTVRRAPGPVVATAIHGGHDLRPDVALFVALGDAERHREEDPYSGAWAAVGDSSVVVHRSRFEVDLNRDRYHAVYERPEDAWGLHVWREPLPPEVAERPGSCTTGSTRTSASSSAGCSGRGAASS
ncbi:MAG: hypothetical protein ACRDJO_12170 [Actinomycetota bacterium]